MNLLVPTPYTIPVPSSLTTDRVTTNGHGRSGRLSDLVAIVLRPRTTMRRILDEEPERFAKSILFLTICSAFLEDFELEGLQEAQASLQPWTLAAIIAAGVVVGSLVFLLMYYLFCWSALWVGKWLGGSARFRDVRSAIVWGFTPFVWALLYRVPAAVVAWVGAAGGGAIGAPRFEIGDGQMRWSGGSWGSYTLAWIFILFVLDLIVLTLYLVVASRTLGEAHRFSSWKGLANLLLAFVMPFVAAGLVAFVTWVYFQRV